MPELSAAARSEEIQKRLQLIRERREREQRAFDELAAQSPGLSADAIRALARQRAEAETPREMRIDGGLTIRVGDSVKVVDDVLQLSRSERGLLLPDPVKRIYLGEKGRVLRVMHAFHNKPAVELRFADGAEKVFFTECLDLGSSAKHSLTTSAPIQCESALPVASTLTSSSAVAGLAVRPAAVVAPPSPMPLLGWSELASLTRQARGPNERQDVQQAHTTLDHAVPRRAGQVVQHTAATDDVDGGMPPTVVSDLPSSLQQSSPARVDAQTQVSANHQSMQDGAGVPLLSHSQPSSSLLSSKTHDTHRREVLAGRAVGVGVAAPVRSPTTGQAVLTGNEVTFNGMTGGRTQSGHIVAVQNDSGTTGAVPAQGAAAMRDEVLMKSRQATVNTPQAHSPAALTASPFQCLGLVKEVVADHVVGAADPGELGRPYEALGFDIALRPYATEADDLLATPRPDLLLTIAPVQLSAEKITRPVADDQYIAKSGTEIGTDMISAIPTHCPANYHGRFAFTDVTTQVPRYTRPRAPHTRRCWVAGLASEASHRLVEYVAVTLQMGGHTTLRSVLRSVSDALGWHVPQLQASRLFTVDGDEVMRPETIQEAMRLVATPGFRYIPVLLSQKSSGYPPHACSDVPVTATQTRPPRMVAAAGTSGYSERVTAARASVAPSGGATPGCVACASDTSATKTAGTPGGPRMVRKQPCLALTAAEPTAMPPQTKPIHVRVFENGVYDEDSDGLVYRTITVRPTYKSLKALHSIIERELGWRDGRRVDTLYDASGAEITSLTELFDGEAIVASAGDRFVVPYPNTVLHQEALKLSQQYRGR